MWSYDVGGGRVVMEVRWVVCSEGDVGGGCARGRVGLALEVSWVVCSEGDVGGGCVVR